jgi:hypothetical protein
MAAHYLNKTPMKLSAKDKLPKKKAKLIQNPSTKEKTFRKLRRINLTKN